MSEEEFIKRLKEISKKLEKGEVENIRNLRELSRNINTYDIFTTWTSTENMFLAYFLRLFIDDFWKNFAVDASYEITDEEISNLCKTWGKQFYSLIECMTSNQSKCYKHLALTVGVYTDLISKAENRARGKI